MPNLEASKLLILLLTLGFHIKGKKREELVVQNLRREPP